MSGLELAMCNEAFINLVCGQASALNDIVSNRTLWLARAATAQYDLILHVLVSESPLTNEELFLISDNMRNTRELFTPEWIPYLRVNTYTPLENPANYNRYARIILELGGPFRFILCELPLLMCSDSLYDQLKENVYTRSLCRGHVSDIRKRPSSIMRSLNLPAQESIIQRIVADSVAREALNTYIHRNTFCPVSLQRMLLARPDLIQMNSALESKIRQQSCCILQRNPSIEQYIYETYFVSRHPGGELAFALYLNYKQNEITDNIIEYCKYNTVDTRVILNVCSYRLPPNGELLISRENFKKLLRLFDDAIIWELLGDAALIKNKHRCNAVISEMKSRGLL